VRLINVDDAKTAARRYMPRAVFDFIEGGAEDEIGLARTRAAFEALHLVPRVGRDVSTVSLETRVLGRGFSAPFGIAPMGLADLFRPGSDAALARAAAISNIPFALSAASSSSLETLGPILGDGLWCQIYGTRDRAIMHDMADRARAIGVETIVLTLDVPVDARRERNIRNRFALPYRPTPAAIVDALRHPLWLRDYLAAGGMPTLGSWVKYAPSGASAPDVAAVFKTQTPDPSQSWEDVKCLRDLWPGKLVLKGVLHPDDARISRQLGADGVIVSNHGARQLDRAPPPISMVRAIKDVAGQQMNVILDGGIRRGSDVVSALCAGADFVLVGRSMLYGAVAHREVGVKRIVDILAQEVRETMMHLGCPAVSALDAGFVFNRHPGALTPSMPETNRPLTGA
jgi:L-lactate dehydrogenase (cytochrome)/(S)-mandelate dehydrogenase